MGKSKLKLSEMTQIPQIDYISFITPNQLFVKPTLSTSKITAQSVTELNVPNMRLVNGKKLLSASHTPRSMILCDKVTNTSTYKESELLS